MAVTVTVELAAPLFRGAVASGDVSHRLVARERVFCNVLARVFVVAGFWLAFLVTLALMGTAVVTGRRRIRRVHLWVGPLTMLSLLVTVLFAEQLVSKYEFPEGPMAIHLVFAKSAGLLALPVIVTGVLLARRPGVRLLHRIAVGLFVLAALVATGTGIWIFSLAELR